ncbi:hypothetical protein [Paracoccus sp. TOH]|uniref:CopL family metal-binding regulatory protein n=1 Tax=Paracoccus simplex TaxID=2086346 RepID=A0ABV7S5Z2_9RHOB|nr:hypothetical protein [Paracoccus sp. TOH]WJS84798.1 hypothetical protein NBE95_03180 [Paracoccus sp. TOH]
MDILIVSPYFEPMTARLVSLLFIIAITVVTTVASAHAARMVALDPAPATHATGMMHASDGANPDCKADGHCGSGDAEICELVCAGLAAIITSRTGAADHAWEPTRRVFPVEETHVSRAPGLNERPPKPRLL